MDLKEIAAALGLRPKQLNDPQLVRQCCAQHPDDPCAVFLKKNLELRKQAENTWNQCLTNLKNRKGNNISYDSIRSAL